MIQLFDIGLSSNAKVKKANFLIRNKTAFIVTIYSHDKTGPITYETTVIAKTYKEAVELAYDEYLNS